MSVLTLILLGVQSTTTAGMEEEIIKHKYDISTLYLNKVPVFDYWHDGTIRVVSSDQSRHIAVFRIKHLNNGQ